MEDAVNAVRPRHAAYAKAAWTFLDTFGYINFGVAPALAPPPSMQNGSKGTVIVVGAGLAGELQTPVLGMMDMSFMFMSTAPAAAYLPEHAMSRGDAHNLVLSLHAGFAGSALVACMLEDELSFLVNKIT